MTGLKKGCLQHWKEYVNNMDIVAEIELFSSEEFSKAVINNNWVVFSEADINLFVEHVAKSANCDEDIEKAKKDISKLVQKRIVDSIGRTKLVWVKRMDMIRKPNQSGEASGTDVHADALARHHHNTKVQRMGKEASLKQVERHFGKEVVDKIREQSVLQPVKPAAEAKPTEGGSGVEYMTAGRNKIDVHQNAIDTIKIANGGKADNQADIESAKSKFVKYMTKTEGYTDKQSVIVFHKYLKTGDNSQVVSNGDSEGGYFTIDMEDALVSAGEKAAEPEVKVKRTITDENLDAKITEYTDDMVKKIEKDGMKVDSRWREGIENNFKVLVEHIDNADWGALKEFLTTKYPQWRKFYTEYTGIALPDSDKDTSMFLFKHMHKK